jgi:formate hydrogenlyase subunit 4
MGWVNQCRAWLQNRSAPPASQPYRTLRKLFHKDAVIWRTRLPLFRFAPYMIFGCMVLAAGIVPILATDLPFAPAADVIALVGLFALARVFMALAAMDIGTASARSARGARCWWLPRRAGAADGVLHRRLISQSTVCSASSRPSRTSEFAIYPSLAFAAVAFWMVSLAENARIPVDNPTTHLELTMIHEAMILEYSGRHLALIEWAVALKLFTYSAIGIALFVPWGIAAGGRLGRAAAGACGAGGEAAAGRRRARLPRDGVGQDAHLPRAGVPRHAFLLAVLGMLIHFLLEA